MERPDFLRLIAAGPAHAATVMELLVADLDRRIEELERANRTLTETIRRGRIALGCERE